VNDPKPQPDSQITKDSLEAALRSNGHEPPAPDARWRACSAPGYVAVHAADGSRRPCEYAVASDAAPPFAELDAALAEGRLPESPCAVCAWCVDAGAAKLAPFAAVYGAGADERERVEIVRLPRDDGEVTVPPVAVGHRLVLEDARPLSEGASEWADKLPAAGEGSGIELRAAQIGDVEELARLVSDKGVERIELTLVDGGAAELDSARRAADALGAELRARFVFTPDSWHWFEAAMDAAAEAGAPLTLAFVDRGGALPIAALTPEELLVVTDAVTSTWERFEEAVATPDAAAKFEQVCVALRAVLARGLELAVETPQPGDPLTLLSLPGIDHPWLGVPDEASGLDGWRWIEQLFGHSHLPIVQTWITRQASGSDGVKALQRTPWLRVLCQKLAWEQRDAEMLATLRDLYSDDDAAQPLLDEERGFAAAIDLSPFRGPWHDVLGLPRRERTPPIPVGDGAATRRGAGEAPRITVLIPSYRHERFIADTVQSALDQTGVEVRVLVVDDRSPDGTADVARGIEDERLEVRVNEQNLGLGNSVVQALATIDTPYVALLNSDDLFHPERLSRCVQILDDDEKVQVVTTGLHLIDDRNGALTTENVSLATDGVQIYNWVHWYERARMHEDLSAEQVFEELLERNFLATSSNLTARTDWLRAKQASFTNLKFCLDWQIFLDAAIDGALYHVAAPLAGYRLHATNTVWFPAETRWEFYLETSRVLAEALRHYVARAGRIDRATVERVVHAVAAHAAHNRETDGFAILLNAVFDGLELDRVAADSAAVQALLRDMQQAAAATVQAQDAARNRSEAHKLADARGKALARVRREQLVHENSLKERRAVALTERLGELREGYEGRLADAQARCDQLRETGVELRGTIQDLHQRHRTDREGLEARLTDLRERTDSLRERNESLREKNEGLREKNEILRGRLASEQAALWELHGRIRSVRDEIASADSMSPDITSVIHDIQAEFLAAVAERDQLRTSFDDYRKRKEADLQRLASRRDQLLRQTQELRAEVHSLRTSREFRTGNFLWNKLPLSYMSRRTKKWYNRLIDAKNRVALWAGGKRKDPKAEGLAIVASCWHWPIYSHTFVYQEMLALTHMGLDVKMIHWAENDLAQLQPAFAYLKDNRVQIKSNMKQHRSDKEHFEKTRPGRLQALIEKLSEATGRTTEDLNEEPLLLRACTFARHAELAGADSLHSYFFYDQSFMVLVAAWLLDIPRGVSCYADHMMDDYPLKVVPLQLQLASVIVATSARIKEELVGIGGPEVADKIVVKPNGVNGERFEAIDRGERAEDEPFEVLSISRLEPKKGLEYLIEATAALKQRGHKLKVHLIGAVDTSLQASIDYGAELENQIRELGLEEEVLLHGMMMHEQIQPIMQRCRAFVAPYVELESGDKDGIPTAMLEALASGLPIVTTDSGSILEVVQDGVQALVTPQRDSAAYGAALERLITEPALERQLARAARARFDAEFDIKVTERRLHERVADALQQKATAAR